MLQNGPTLLQNLTKLREAPTSHNNTAPIPIPTDTDSDSDLDLDTENDHHSGLNNDPRNGPDNRIDT